MKSYGKQEIFRKILLDSYWKDFSTEGDRLVEAWSLPAEKRPHRKPTAQPGGKCPQGLPGCDATARFLAVYSSRSLPVRKFFQ
jgi:hypothetical protein